MSYLDYFIKNIIKDKAQEDPPNNQAQGSMAKALKREAGNSREEIKGSCHSMCPKDEELLRVREHMVHVLEKCGTDMNLVKSYTRSAADSNMAVPQNLRPFYILRFTVAYLLFEVTSRTDVPTPVVYDFINDRLKAVRQDMTIQRLSLRECAHLLEPMIRFYVYYGYRLNGLPLKDFDPVLHKQNLLECLKWFLNCCDSTKDLNIYDEDLTPSELGDLMANMSIEQASDKLACDQVLMETLYILCNLDDIHPLRRFVNLPIEFKRNPKLKQAFSIAVANRKRNYVNVTKMMRGLCPLAYCAMCQYLPELQRRAIQVMSLAYSRRLPVPGSVVRQWLAFGTDAEAVAACAHYGQAVKDNIVTFDKGTLNLAVPMHKSNIRLLENDKVDLSLLHVFTYTTK